MSSILEAIVDDDLKEISHSRRHHNSHNCKRKIKSKENYFKSKCSKELKRKLRKYKLRRDGNEDPEVLDVSQILITSLTLKSPNSSDKILNNNNKLDTENPKPSNYLFKMVRKKKCSAPLECNNSVDNKILHNGSDIQSMLQNEEQKNKQNAFKMMMDSRNKSIGSNSPGKEKQVDETVLQEILEKKAVKAKRILSLQKMAESKGSLKNQEMEDYREKSIKKKMIKRAELLKEMITKNDSKNDSKINKKNYSKSDNTPEIKPSKEIAEQSKSLNQINKTLKLCDIFSETNAIIHENKQHTQVERVSDEDIEFLKKLSPSIRKKENMLCYFKKVSKEPEQEDQSDNYCSDESSSSVIKVKFTPKRKKKLKLLKPVQEDTELSCNDKPVENVNKLNNNKGNDNIHTENGNTRKRKREKKNAENLLTNQNHIEASNNENRPKRNTKKPVKYTEDVHCFSSDEELHIFTPKKKRNSDNIQKSKSKKNVQDIDSKLIEDNHIPIKEQVLLQTSNQSNNNIKIQTMTSNKVKLESKKSLKLKKNVNIKKSNLNSEENDKKSLKLAPIFVTKPQLSQAALEAKQKFLKSGVPEKLKKNVDNTVQVSNNTYFDSFYSVVHVQQNESCVNNYKERHWFKNDNDLEEIPNEIANYSFKSLLKLSDTDTLNLPTIKHRPDSVLKCIKTTYPKFPVYRTYHRLKSKQKGDLKDINYTDLDNSVEIIDSCTELNNDNPEKLNWCDKYKSTSSKQIIGNFESIKELKRWLETWSEKLIKSKTNTNDISDMSDFYSSDVDSRDSIKSSNNVLIICGKTGSGKTSSVYAVAAELAIKVIEVNASSKRNGKIMLQDLQEATQSHKVDRAKSGSESSQKSQEIPLFTYGKKRGRPKKTQQVLKRKEIDLLLSQPSSSQESGRTGMSLILIDDADIVFDQDDGFCSAISQLVQSSKRPVILVTSSLSCPHLQKFIQNGKVLHMRPLLPRMLGTWLDIMCLADVGKCYMGLGEKLLEYYRGDIRKTINYLQFYMNSYRNGKHTDDMTMSEVNYNIDDENSGMSWADTENLVSLMPLHNELQNVYKHLQLLQCNSLNICDMWWDLSQLYDVKESSTSSNDKANNHKLADILSTLSATDHNNRLKPEKRIKHMSNAWYCDESASLLESEDFACYNQAHYLSQEISEELVNSTISEAYKLFKTDKSINVSPMNHYRDRDRLVSRHNTLSSYLNPSAILDRKATALDYWPACRTICRLEKNKTDSNMKRNNRFCHYLKSLNILCKNDFFDNLADSLT